jgi:hypothetical protein
MRDCCAAGIPDEMLRLRFADQLDWQWIGCTFWQGRPLPLPLSSMPDRFTRR